MFDWKLTNTLDKIDDNIPLNSEVDNFLTAVNLSPPGRRMTAAFAKGGIADANGVSTKNSNQYIEVDTVTRIVLNFNYIGIPLIS